VTIRVPDHILRISPYVPGKPIEEAERQFGIDRPVKLASNENPLGPSPKAVQAIRDAAARVHRYPDSTGHDLRQALSPRVGFPVEQIVLGNGSTELVELLAKIFLTGGRGAVVADQAFIMYQIAVRAMGAPLTLVPLTDHRHDLQKMSDACDERTALVYIGNPNNPSGTYVTRAEMRSYFDRLPAQVLTVVDEAYFDYVERPDYPDCLEFLREGRNVVVLRTFSKIHGLAGMRLGYAVTPREIATCLETIRSPFNTSFLAQVAARAALEDADHVSRSRAENRREVRYLSEQLAQRQVDFIPTVANFLLITTRMEAGELYQRLLRLGVIVRPMEAYGYPRAVRVSLGLRQENLRFLEALDRVLLDAGGRDQEPGGAS
jgi:histidinol-phosphate aminotransferase